MRTFAALAMIAAMLGVTNDAGAQARYYPWCARYNAYTYNCGFTTLQQCQATISGIGGICQQNAMPAPLVESRARHRRKHRRHR